MTEHIEPDVLELYVLGRLSEKEAAQIEEHLLVCEDCRDRLSEEDEVIEIIKQFLLKARKQSEESE